MPRNKFEDTTAQEKNLNDPLSRLPDTAFQIRVSCSDSTQDNTVHSRLETAALLTDAMHYSKSSARYRL
jgi:hypothetical protein